MSRLLEILGRAITVDVADLIWHWLDTLRPATDKRHPAQTERLNKIAELVAERKTDSAESQLKLYLFEHGDCFRGRMAAAAICLSKAQLKDAIEQLNSVYVRQPSNTVALYALGHCYERLGKQAQAIEFYQDCLKFKNYLQPPRQRLAAIYFKNGQLEKTVQEYEMLRAEYPADMPTLLTLGHLYIACARHPQAIDTFNTAILIHPDNSYYEDHELEQLMHAGQAYEALSHLEQLCQDQPERADLSLKHADVLSMMGDNDRAASQYQQALSLCPDFLEATIKLGTHYLRMQEPKLAAKQFNRAVDINDRIVEAYIGLALAQKFAANTDEALTTLSLAAAIQPNSSLLFAETATLQFRAGFQGPLPLQTVTESTQLMQAVIDAHRRQITERPYNADLHYRLGLLLTSICRPDAAINAFRTALTINPAHSRARSKLGLSIFEVGRHEQALNELANVPAVSTETLALHYKTALLYADKIRFASSLLNLERNLAENFTTSDASVNVSIVLQNLGLLDRATATWDSLAATTNQALQSFYGPAPGQC